MAELRLPGVHKGDALIINSWDRAGDLPIIFVDRGTEYAIWIGRASARELFNRLGVLLHKFPPV